MKSYSLMTLANEMSGFIFSIQISAKFDCTKESFIRILNSIMLFFLKYTEKIYPRKYYFGYREISENQISSVIMMNILVIGTKFSYW